MSEDLPGLFSQLIRLETELWDAIDARLRAEFELPLSRFELMQVIAEREGCRVNDIAGDLSITVGGTSKLVDRIEASGHCRRRPNPDDRRSSIIDLTPAGRRLLAAASSAFEGELELRLGSVLSTPARAQLSRTLARLRTAGRQIDGSRRLA